MTIFANHAHVFPADDRPEGTLEELKVLMDTCGIAKAVAFAPFVEQVHASKVTPNTWLADSLVRYKNIIGFGTIDLDAGNTGRQAEKIAELGFRGVKLHPAFQRFHVLDERLTDFYAAAEQLGLFLVFHTGVHWYRVRDYHPLLFDELAHFYPNLKFSMEHVGGASFFLDALAVLTNTTRKPPEASAVFAGITSVLNENHNILWYLTDEQIQKVVSFVGSERMIFGLDFPYNGIAETKESIDRIHALNISDEDKENILGNTLSRVLQLS